MKNGETYVYSENKEHVLIGGFKVKEYLLSLVPISTYSFQIPSPEAFTAAGRW